MQFAGALFAETDWRLLEISRQDMYTQNEHRDRQLYKRFLPRNRLRDKVYLLHIIAEQFTERNTALRYDESAPRNMAVEPSSFDGSKVEVHGNTSEVKTDKSALMAQTFLQRYFYATLYHHCVKMEH